MRLNLFSEKDKDLNVGKIGDLPEEKEEIPVEGSETTITENPEESHGGYYENLKTQLTAKGLKKKIIYGVGGAAVLIGAIAIGSNFFEDSAPKTANNYTDSSNLSPASPKINALGYEELARMDGGNQKSNTSPQQNSDPSMNPNLPVGYENSEDVYAHTYSYSQPTMPVIEEKPTYVDSEISFSYVAEAAANSTPEATVNTFSAASYADNYVLKAGTTIPVTLLTGITSDLSGAVIVQVRQDVYDSLNGVAILIPAGAKLLGKYNTGSADGRMSVEFSTMQLPNGRTIDLSAAHGIDGIGFAGVKDKYSEHTGRVLGASFVSSLIAAVAGSSSSGIKKDDRSRGQEALDSAIGNLIETTNKIVDRKMDSSPTATIRPGFRFNVFLGEDLQLPRY